MARKIFMMVMAGALMFFMINPVFGADNPSPPSSPVKLIFIHHSTGGNLLADPNSDGPYGGLGIALKNNNYYVSATNYGWGPYSIGDRTAIVEWPEWFTGSNSSEIMNAVYNETGQNVGDFGSWSRLSNDPGGENTIIMFKSCFPNSDLYGNPNDPPASETSEYQYTVSSAKAIYNKLLTYFQTRQDKLFIVITAPPLNESEYAPGDQTPAQRAANARAFNNWLVFDWLKNYPYKNVAVFDYYTILTEPGNHHRWNNGSIEHIISSKNFAYYPSGEYDSHPNTEGQQKATTEFVPLLNIFYNRWKDGGSSTYTGHRLAGDYGSAGLYLFDGNNWKWVAGNPEDMESWGNYLVGDFAELGLYRYDGTNWSWIGGNPDGMGVWGHYLMANFPGYGLYRYDGNDWAWIGPSANKMTEWGQYFAADFTGYGLCSYDGSNWSWIGPSPDEMTGWGHDLVADFPGYGLYRYNGSAWSWISGSPDGMTAWGADLLANFTGYGTYRYDGNQWSWFSGNVENAQPYGYRLFSDFGDSGIYMYETGNWTWIGGNPEDIEVVTLP